MLEQLFHTFCNRFILLNRYSNLIKELLKTNVFSLHRTTFSQALENHHPSGLSLTSLHTWIMYSLFLTQYP